MYYFISFLPVEYNLNEICAFIFFQVLYLYLVDIIY
mgnify:CR=1 FL=1